MPILQYFGWVGASLLALLFIVDAQLPKVAERAEPARNFSIRIASKPIGPEAITFTGYAVNHGPPPAMEVVDFAARAPDAAAADIKAARLKQSLARAAPEFSAQAAAKPAPAPRKRYARRRIEPTPPNLVEAWGLSAWTRYQ